MSNIKVKDLPEKTNELDDDDLLIVEDTEDTKKISLIKLRSVFSMDGILTSMKNTLLEKISSFTLSLDNKYKELEDRNRQLEVTCNNLENDHIHDSNRIHELENKLILEKERVTSIEEERDDLILIIENLQNDKNNLSEKIIELNAQLEFNKIHISSLQNMINDLETRSNEMSKLNGELQNLITKLEEEANSSINEFSDEINYELSCKIDNLMTYLRYYHPDIDNVEVE